MQHKGCRIMHIAGEVAACLANDYNSWVLRARLDVAAAYDVCIDYIILHSTMHSSR
jgi:hypothetical protein